MKKRGPKPTPLVTRILARTVNPEFEQYVGQHPGDWPSEVASVCWIWTGATSKGDPHRYIDHKRGVRRHILHKPLYGMVKDGTQMVYAHRAILEAQHGTEVSRTINMCGNTLCINPTHWSALKKVRSTPTPKAEVIIPVSTATPMDELMEVIEFELDRNRVQSFQWLLNEFPDFDKCQIVEALRAIHAPPNLIPEGICI